MGTVGRLQEGKLKIAGELVSKNILDVYSDIKNPVVENTGDSFTCKAWASTSLDNAWVLSHLQPNTSYTMKYDVTLLTKSSLTSWKQTWGRFLLYRVTPALSTPMGGISEAQYNAMNVGDTLTSSSAFTTPSDLTNCVVLLFTARATDGATVELDTMKFSNVRIAEGTTNIGTFNLTSTGDLKIAGEIKEQPDIPSDVYYFPLTFDAKDITHTFSPSAQSNLVFSRDGVWVGTATQNYYTGVAPYANNGGSILDVSNTEGEFGFLASVGAKTYKLIKDGTGNQWNGFQGTYGNWITGSAGAGFTASGYYKTTDNASAELGAFEAYSTDWVTKVGDNTVNIGLGSPLQDDKWNYFVSTCKLNQAYTGAIGATLPNWGYSTEAGTLYLHGMMWEKKPFASPFCATTRGEGKLQYNFNSSLGLDWNGDWTICYWKKPVGTHNNTMTRYNLESFGSNHSALSEGYFWVGKQSGDDKVCCGGAKTIPGADIIIQSFSQYFNKWHMCSIRKSEGNLIFNFYGIDGESVQSGAITIGTISSTAFVNLYGYDFMLGGFNNGNPPNSYYKDLVVAKRALTDDELFSIYKTQMKSYNSSGILQVRSEISEGDLL